MSKIIHLHNKKNGFLSAHNDHVDLRAESHEHSVWTLGLFFTFAVILMNKN